MASETSVQPRRVMRLHEVMARTGLGRATVYRLIAAGEFPRQLRLSRAGSGWLSDEVDAWIDARAAARSGVRS